MTNNNDLDDGVGMPGPFSNSNVRARRVAPFSFTRPGVNTYNVSFTLKGQNTRHASTMAGDRSHQCVIEFVGTSS